MGRLILTLPLVIKRLNVVYNLIGICLCFNLVIPHCSAQVEQFVEVAPFSKGNYASDLIPTIDGGYFVVNEHLNLFGQVDRQFPLVLKYNSCNQLIKSQIFIEEFSILEVSDAVGLEDGRIAICGYYYNGANYDTYILVLDVDGDLDSYYRFSTDKNEICYSIDQLPSEDIFIYMNHSPVAGGPSKNTIILFDKNFNIKWQRAFNEIGIWGNAIACSDNSILARTGNTIFKVTNEAEIVFNRSYEPFMTTSFEPVELSDGYVFARRNEGLAGGSRILKLNVEGEPQWAKGNFDFLSFSRVIKEKDQVNLINMIFDGAVNKGLLLSLSPDGEIIQNIGMELNPPGVELIIHDQLVINEEDRLFCGSSQGQLLIFTDQQNESCMISSPGIEIDDLEFSSSQFTPKVSTTNIKQTAYTIWVQDFEIFPERICEELIPAEDVQIDTTLCFGDSIKLIGPDLDVNYYWSNGKNTRSIIVSESGTYILELEECGRSWYWNFNVNAVDCPCEVEFANAFTPNSDNKNDYYSVSGDCSFISYEIKIYSRWGQEVFASDDPDIGWDGTFNGKKASSDVYIAKVKYSRYQDGQIVNMEYIGDLTLLR